MKAGRPRTTDTYDSVSWLGHLPDHAAVRSTHRTVDAGVEDPILLVDRVPPRPGPPVPDQLVPWLDGSTEDPDGEPHLREEIADPNPPLEDGSEVWLLQVDQADVRDTYETWLALWTRWAEQELADRPVRELYKQLFATYVKVNAHTEELEYVLGVGCLAWKPAGHDPVRRHLLTSGVTITLDDNTGTLAVTPQPGLEVLTVELDMLDPARVPNPRHINEVQSQAREFDQHPLDRDHVGDLVRRLVNALDAQGEYRDDDDPPDSSDAPLAAFAPALIVRKRTQLGLVGIFRSIADRISEAGDIPSGLLPLLDPDHQPAARPDPSDGALIAVDDETFLPLPLNAVQLSIIQRVDRHAQTLVQGPPGTGKTHTAAALLSHLLAQGKRVLVTAHTDRALKEVRAKLPESIRPLAVSVVGTDRSDMADLKVAVEHISARSGEHDSEQARDLIGAHLTEIDRLRRQRAEIRTQLIEARSTEVDTHEFAGNEGTLAQIAQTCQAETEIHGWLADLARPTTDSACPLDDGSATRWLSLLRDADLLADEPEAGQRLINPSDTPDPDDFARHVDGEAAGRRGLAAHTTDSSHTAFTAVAALHPQVRDTLQTRTRDLARRVTELEQRHESWMNSALRDIRGGRGGTWDGRATHLRGLIDVTAPLVDLLGLATEVTLAESADPGAMASLAGHLRGHVTASGPVKTNPDGTVKVGRLTAKAVKQARPLFEAVLVNGLPPTTAEQLTAIEAHLAAQLQLAALDKAWPADVVVPAEDTARERLQWHVTELRQLDRLLEVGRDLQIEEGHLTAAGLTRPDWNDMASVLTYARLVDAATAQDTYAAAAEPLQALARDIAVVSTWDDAADAVHQLESAVGNRDRDAYAGAHGRLTRLQEVRALIADRDALTSRVRAAAPDLAAAVLADPGDRLWDQRVPNLPRAWDWLRTCAWILRQDTTDVNVLQTKIGVLDGRLRRSVEVVASTRAWDHALAPDRLTGQSRADLTQYAQLVRRLGKGTGKYAPARRGEVRRAMDRCRPAVPVWIMPIYRIAEQLHVLQNMFDVVIVDEASQAGLEATFLQYLAPKIVVIGDDRQVSPAAVGVDQQKLRDLANRYLAGDRYKDTWQDPKRSLFDEAAMRFGSRLTLVEHRRCVPEIIGFSNRIAYEPDNVRLIPVRQYGTDRLEPIKMVHVRDGYEQGGSTKKVNPAEADAIVDQLCRSLADPRYDGLTFGVISLQGAAQARRIQAALLERVPPKEWTARDLRCGDAADFQGSERDVVFLSMVSAPEAGQRLGSMTQEGYVQRYNVAASRAKDQMWVFHSIGLDQLPNTEDMRHHLLDYGYGVVGRSRTEHGDSATTSVPEDVPVEPFDSLFEQRVHNRLVDRGFTVVPQFPASGYRIDLVVVGAKGRLAIECDGDAWHGPERYGQDMARQRDLERCGWQFFRIRESAYYVDQHAVLSQLWKILDEHDIRPSDWSPKNLDTAADGDVDDHGRAEHGGVCGDVTFAAVDAVDQVAAAPIR